jgi:hypothetical protein
MTHDCLYEPRILLVSQRHIAWQNARNYGDIGTEAKLLVPITINKIFEFRCGRGNCGHSFFKSETGPVFAPVGRPHSYQRPGLRVIAAGLAE